MRKSIVSLLLLSYFFTIGAQQFVSSIQQEKSSDVVTPVIRQKINMDKGWHFVAGPLSPEMENAWTGHKAVIEYPQESRILDIPHDFQMEMPWNEKAPAALGFKDGGMGWYRKTFTVDPGWKGSKVLLDFEGIMMWGDVWVNGHKVLSTDYGYLGAETDISGLIDYEGENVIAVKADTGRSKGSRWYTGGGLYRPVWLVVKAPVSVARHGVFVQSEIRGCDAVVDISVELNGHSRKNDITVNARIIDPDGTCVATASAKAFTADRKKMTMVKLPSVAVGNPKLWSIAAPSLYKAEIEVLCDGMSVDQVSVKFGVRNVEFSPEFGMKLNGEKIFLKGIAGHIDHGAPGVADHKEALVRQMKRLREFGFNFIRCSHNPYSATFYDMADSLGFIVVDELYDKWSDKDYWVGRQPFTSVWHRHLSEWVRRDRNHPSVVCWSFGNELQMREDLCGFQTSDWGITTYQLMKTLQKRYDPTRPSTVAMFPDRANAERVRREIAEKDSVALPPELSEVTDIASYNYQYWEYPKYLRHNPNLIILQSEASTSELMRPYFAMDHDRMVGLGYWGAIDYWGESKGWPAKGWNFSFFEHTLLPKPEAYAIRSAFLPDEPVVRIAVEDGGDEVIVWNEVKSGKKNISSHWNRTAGRKYKVFVYSNGEEVELKLDGKSLGRLKNMADDPERRNIFSWDSVPYSGPGKIEAVAFDKAGRQVATHELKTTGKAVALRLVAEDVYPSRPGDAPLRYVRIEAVDKKGNVVPDADDEIFVRMKGDAELAFICNGDHYSDALFVGRDSVNLYHGVAFAIVRLGDTQGNVVMTAVSPELRGGKLTIAL